MYTSCTSVSRRNLFLLALKAREMQMHCALMQKNALSDEKDTFLFAGRFCQSLEGNNFVKPPSQICIANLMNLSRALSSLGGGGVLQALLNTYGPIKARRPDMLLRVQSCGHES